MDHCSIHRIPCQAVPDVAAADAQPPMPPLPGPAEPPPHNLSNVSVPPEMWLKPLLDVLGPNRLFVPWMDLQCERKTGAVKLHYGSDCSGVDSPAIALKCLFRFIQDRNWQNLSIFKFVFLSVRPVRHFSVFEIVRTVRTELNSNF